MKLMFGFKSITIYYTNKLIQIIRTKIFYENILGMFEKKTHNFEIK